MANPSERICSGERLAISSSAVVSRVLPPQELADSGRKLIAPAGELFVAAQEQEGALMRDFAAELREPQFMAAEDARQGVAQLQCGGVEPSLDARHPFDEPSGDGRRGFKCRVGHHVRDARILS